MSLTCTNTKMKTFSDKLQKTTALVYYEDKFISSGIIFKTNDNIYAITAGHSIYGTKFTETKDVIKLKIKIGAVNLSVENIVGDSEFAKEHDIVILKISGSDNYLDILSYEFWSVPKNPIHNLVFRGSYDVEKGINNFWDNHFDETLDNTAKYKIQCKKEYLSNSNYDHGSDWLGGISGSGLFYQNKETVCCCGIIVEILNKGDEGKVLCASIEPLTKILPELNLIQSEVLDRDNSLSNVSLRNIIAANDAQVVSDWENNPENDTEDNPRITYINRKLPLIYPKTQLVEEKTRLIRNFCIGTELIEIELTRNETLMSIYTDAYKSYDIQEKIIYADTRKDARGDLKNIKDKYESYLHSMLKKEGFEDSMIILLKEYAISEWISNCSINILKDE